MNNEYSIIYYYISVSADMPTVCCILHNKRKELAESSILYFLLKGWICTLL